VLQDRLQPLYVRDGVLAQDGVTLAARQLDALREPVEHDAVRALLADAGHEIERTAKECREHICADGQRRVVAEKGHAHGLARLYRHAVADDRDETAALDMRGEPRRRARIDLGDLQQLDGARRIQPAQYHIEALRMARVHEYEHRWTLLFAERATELETPYVRGDDDGAGAVTRLRQPSATADLDGRREVPADREHLVSSHSANAKNPEGPASQAGGRARRGPLRCAECIAATRRSPPAASPSTRPRPDRA
jgi:hypothetical protein